MLTQPYLRAVSIAVIMLASCSAVSFAQGTTAPLKPLSVGTVTLYYNEYVWNGWNTYCRISPASCIIDRYDRKGEGYFFTKVIGDTVINGKQYAIVYTSILYTNTQKLRTGSDDYEITYERLTDSALYQFIPGYDSRRQKTDLEREVFNIGTKKYYDFSCFSPPFSDCTTQISGDEFTISCHRPGDANFCHQSVTIKSGYGIIQMRKQNQSSNTSFQFDYHYDKTQFIGAISNGKVLGDSLVLSLDTEWNILDTTMKNQVLSSNNLDNNRLKIRSQIADNTLSLKLITNIDQQITIEIFSLLGQLVFQDAQYIHKGNTQVDLNIGYLPPGLYFIRVYSKEGVSTSKILISN